MLERSGVHRRATWGQFQPSRLLALIPQLNWMKDILLPSPRRRRRRGRQTRGGVEETSVFYLTNMAWCSTNCFYCYTDNLMFSSVSSLLCKTLAASSPTLFCKSSPLFPANINPDGLYQCFVFLSVLPGLSLSSCFPLQCIQIWTLILPRPVRHRTRSLEQSSVCMCVCGLVYVLTCATSARKHLSSCQSLCVWSKNNYLMGLLFRLESLCH